MVGTQVASVACVLLFVAAVGHGAGVAPHAGAADVTPSASGGAASQLAGVAATQSAPETDNTITRIVVHENGSATWHLEIRTRLENDTEVESYRAFQEEFRSNTSSYLGPFQESITGVVANAADATGREMAATAFGASTSIQQVPQQWGVVEYRFRWDGFAAADGDRLRVGDVFGGGLFIADGDVIEVVAPAGYRVESAGPEPDERESGRVGWTGREDFADGRPAVVLAPGAPEGEGDAGGFPLGDPAGATGLLVAVAAALTAGGYWWRRRRGGWRGSTGTAVDNRGADPSPEADALVTDEDRVVGLLEEAGGRMRQGAIAEELDWSKSKTSRVLSRMDEDGTVEKFRLGRENVIDLADGDGGRE